MNLKSDILNHYIYGDAHISIQHFSPIVWNQFKDVLLESVIGALDCTYGSVKVLYTTLLQFMFENDLETHDRWVARGFGDFFGKTEIYFTSRLERLESFFMYLSLNWSNAASLARTEPTLFLPTTIEPTRTVDGQFMTHLNRVDHDWDSHYVFERKKRMLTEFDVLQSLEEFRTMVKLLKNEDPTIETLKAVTYLDRKSVV